MWRLIFKKKKKKNSHASVSYYVNEVGFFFWVVVFWSSITSPNVIAVEIFSIKFLPRDIRMSTTLEKCSVYKIVCLYVRCRFHSKKNKKKT